MVYIIVILIISDAMFMQRVLKSRPVLPSKRSMSIFNDGRDTRNKKVESPAYERKKEILRSVSERCDPKIRKSLGKINRDRKD